MHSTFFQRGSDDNNYVVRCRCGWAYSGTYRDCKTAERGHRLEDSPLRWDDPRRAFQPDRTHGGAA